MSRVLKIPVQSLMLAEEHPIYDSTFTCVQRWDCKPLWMSWSLWGPSSCQKGRASIWG